jgi:nitrogen fixation protein NifU and related proteins
MAYDMYQERILQHYRNPKNFGQLEHPDFSAEESNPLCGDHIRMDILLDPAKEKVAEIRFSGDGCAISVASASMLTQKLTGQPLAAVEKVTRDDVLQLVAIPLSPVRVKCALTGFTALGRALHGTAASAEAAQA